MTRLEEAIKKQNNYLIRIGDPINLLEADNEYNDMNREVISAFKEHHGKAFLGKNNYYDDERTAVANGEKSPYEVYIGQKIYNFGCDFCVPFEDAELQEMIRRWNGFTGTSGTVPSKSNAGTIIDRVLEIGGINLIWS